MPSSYQTPGVYVQEVSNLPPLVVEASTAIPAFIGYTATGFPTNAAHAAVVRVNTLLEYEQYFGGPPKSCWTATVSRIASSGVYKFDSLGARSVPNGTIDSILYYCVSHYFQNGGDSCCIVSVGSHSGTPTKAHFLSGLAALSSDDEPTLIVLSEAARLLDHTDYKDVVEATLQQCHDLGDRFTIIDPPNGPDTSASEIRTVVGTRYLDYGAAYWPNLKTTLSYQFIDAGISISHGPTGVTHLGELLPGQTALYSKIKALLAQQKITLPPAAAVAGVYASVDRDHGVWKAPANISLAAVVGPDVKIDDADQAQLNVDAATGKSINAIRTFTDKGTLVWGARTLDGNSNEWRFVPVRRLFIMLEESCKKATQFAVFEPNDLTTWAKVKGMIESFLFSLWEQGAFAGATPAEAFRIEVGLGTTMTPQNIENGEMIVAVGVAAVRPAESIVLRFRHNMADS